MISLDTATLSIKWTENMYNGLFSQKTYIIVYTFELRVDYFCILLPVSEMVNFKYL
jgi:hypothetical protein